MAADAPRFSETGPRGRPAVILRVSSLLLSQTTQNFSLGALALLLPLIRDDIPMSFTEAGVLSVLLTVSYAVMQVPAGVIGDRFGAWPTMVVGLFGLNLLTVAIAFAPGYGFLAVVLCVLGAFRALAFAPGLALITAEFGSHRRATAMSLFMASGFVSNLVLSLAAPLLIGPLGWRGLIALFGAASLVPVIAYVVSARVSPPPPTGGGARGTVRLRRLALDPVIWLACIIQFTRLGVTMAVRFWLPTYLVLERGLDLAATAVVVAVASAVSIATTLIGGQVSDRRQQPMLIIIVSLTALAIAVPLLTVAGDTVAVLVVTAAIYVFVQAYSGPLFEVPLLVFGGGAAATLNGIGNGWANVGGLVTTFALGAIADLTGSLDIGWWGLSGLCAVALAAALVLGFLVRRRAPAATSPATARP